MPATADVLDLQLPSGRLRLERTGPADAPLALCVHGLTANLRSFDPLVERLAAPDRQVVALDLRGRGRSEVTPPGTYGLDGHVADILAVADHCGAERFDLVGWSMGALLSVEVAGTGRPQRVVLLDAAGNMDPEAIETVRAGTARLDVAVPDPQLYLDAIKAAGVFKPWGPFWESWLRYEMGDPREDGTWSPRTDRAACLEDLDGAAERDFRAAWPNLTMPTLLVRCLEPLGGGLLVPPGEAEALAAVAPHLEVVESERNHYGLMDDPVVLDAIARFLA